ncbi:hypothetical protein B0H17DRAFT_935498 [Mycena rosella]|uniref:Nephrocystin 3-like N-terminal domain-containing protein n=1 Tax=Mycena rosella TaxID=1033263 RepID=A0AAD7DGF5_MYCRO|nr:hypothetical protein B0H17DRAFT_935498 [Mycena rosella]
MPNILWIKGHPGSGKASIASTLVLSHKYSKEGTRLGPIFFFERDNTAFTTPSVFWRKVSHDLAQLDSRFASRVVAVLKRGDIDFSTTLVDTQFASLMADPLKDIAEPAARRPQFVVVLS